MVNLKLINEENIENMNNAVRKFLKDNDFTHLEALHILSNAFNAVVSKLENEGWKTPEEFLEKYEDLGQYALKCITFSIKLAKVKELSLKE